MQRHGLQASGVNGSSDAYRPDATRRNISPGHGPPLSSSATSPRSRYGSPFGSSNNPQLRAYTSLHMKDDKRGKRNNPMHLYEGGSGSFISLRRGRLRWFLLLFAIVALIFWRFESTPTPAAVTENVVPEKIKEAAEEVKQLVAEKGAAPPPAPVATDTRESETIASKTEISQSFPPSPSTKVIDVNVRPAPRTPLSADSPRDQKRYLAYSPHSGYHNARISLENALTLAFILDRTLLVPPVWVGHAIPYISFDKLGRRLQMATKQGLMERCVPYADTAADEALPRECLGFFDWTQVGWDFLVDLNPARELVPMIERWNLTDEWLNDELGVNSHSKKVAAHKFDRYDLKEEQIYQFRFYDSKSDSEPLAKFENRVELEDFVRETKDYKLVHLGTLFGTSRIRTTLQENYEARSKFRRSMVFHTPLIDEITQQIRDRLGGAGNYYGLHLRVGDGIFQKNAKDNLGQVWQKLCANKMKLDPEICLEMATRSEAKQGTPLRKRSQNSALSATREIPAQIFSNLTKRANSRPQREGAFHHKPLPDLPEIKSRADSPLSSKMTCRGKLHTKETLLPFNAPLFIATDSKLGPLDPNLAIFFNSFPCTFILNDFGSTNKFNAEPIAGLNELAGWRNAEDKVPLAQFMYPQLDAQIAAWGRDLLGTPQSTYSRFAVDVLHQVYHGWEIVERG